MINWYQKFENLKRYEHAINGTVRYQNATLDLNNIEDQLTFKNSGARQKKNELRNYVQALSTEGLINAFFTHLTKSDLSNHYLESSFYRPFLMDTSSAINSPEKIFTPLQNQFLKYFTVFYKYMSGKNSTKPQFIEFFEGCMSSFPSEKEAIKEIFNEVTHLEYSADLPPEIWFLVKNHPHRLLVIDPFGAITMPVYTFDLNGSEVEDLLTIKDLKKEDAIKIIKYRQENGFFTSLGQIKNIPDISNEAVNSILNCEFDQEYFDGLSSPELNFVSLLLAPLKFLLFRTLVYFALIYSLIYFFFLREKKLSNKRKIVIMSKYFFYWIFFVLSGLLFVVLFAEPLHPIILLGMFFISISLLIHRKDKTKRWRSLFTTGLMVILIILSI